MSDHHTADDSHVVWYRIPQNSNPLTVRNSVEVDVQVRGCISWRAGRAVDNKQIATNNVN